MSVLVCYLLAPGEEYAQCAGRFSKSYIRHPAGAEHDFALVVKDGAKPLLTLNWMAAWMASNTILHANDEGQDISSLQRVCQDRSDYDHVVWLGSHSRILADNWLRKMLEALQMPNVGAVGPTGSFEAGVSHESPNPHLRTNVIALSPAILNSLGFSLATSRREAYEFEHGTSSLYRQLEQRDLRCLVVGRDGKAYGKSEWPTSRTYRRDEQQNLLIADKMTDMYANADPDKRVELAGMAGMGSVVVGDRR